MSNIQFCEEDKDHPIIHTSHGSVRGSKRKTVYGDEYFSFQRIPFAKPPVGELRFRDPVPVEPWEQIINAFKPNDSPLQIDWYTKCVTGSEDCLHLNVYVKTLKSEKRLPIMFYIYGGSFYMGAAIPDILSPDYFMMEDVILVTANYRLGPLGFMYFKDPKLKIPGNAGLKDQRMALRWIKENAIYFNGDPRNITIFGNSAGAASVHFLMATGSTRELFQRAIILSGTALNDWAITPQNDYPYLLAVATGYKGSNKECDILTHLMEVSGDVLMTTKVFTDEDYRNGVPFVWGPILEPYESEDSILRERVEYLLPIAWSNKIPIIIGGTSFEALLDIKSIRKRSEIFTLIEREPKYLIPHDIRPTLTEDEIKTACEKIECLHRERDAHFPNIHSLMDILTYTRYWVGIQRTVLQRLRYAPSADTYLYRFDYDSPDFNLYRKRYCGEHVRGAAHADDISYMFYCKEAWELPRDSENFRMIRRMISMWTSFARTSNPNCPELEPVIWKPVTSEKPFQALNINIEPKMLPVLPNGKKWTFWLRLYKELPLSTQSASTSIDSLLLEPLEKKCPNST